MINLLEVSDGIEREIARKNTYLPFEKALKAQPSQNKCSPNIDNNHVLKNVLSFWNIQQHAVV